jgi:hypothetical protein
MKKQNLIGHNVPGGPIDRYLFAQAALTGILAAGEGDYVMEDETWSDLVTRVWDIADAMVAEGLRRDAERAKP